MTTNTGFSYEYAVDLKTGTAGTEADWTSVRFISAVDPTVTPKEKDAATYDDKGADHPVKVGEQAALSFYVQMHRDATTGAFLPEVKALQAATFPDSNGELASVIARYYDAPSAGKGDPDEAFELTGTVSIKRAATGNDDIAGWNVEIKGQGPRRKITNPANTTP